jgi:NAD(P)-dependent dehydrogenase (short-subunit alcohol dehydrogenase family)
MRLKNKNIVLTGASGGIGKHIAHYCDIEGANLFLISRSNDQLNDLLLSLNNINNKSAYFVIDISDEEAVIDTVKKIDILCEGQIHVLINNAGVQSPIGKFSTNSLNDWKENVNINIFGKINMIHEFLPSMIDRQDGRIINLSGGGSTGPRVNFTAYGVAKTAIVRFTETLALELISNNIYVNAVAPGAINTKMLDEIIASKEKAGKELLDAKVRKNNGGDDPKHVAELIVFLASEESSGISGKLISSIWDSWQEKKFQELLLNNKDLATLRRIDNKYFKNN